MNHLFMHLPIFSWVSVLVDVKTLEYNKILSILSYVQLHFVLFVVSMEISFILLLLATVSGYLVAGKQLCSHSQIIEGCKVSFRSAIRDSISC